MNLCLVCGSIKAKSDIENFRDKVLEELEEDEFLYERETEAKNLNEALFKSNYLPSSLEKGEEISVFYYLEKPHIPPADVDFGAYIRDTLGRKVRDVVGEYGVGRVFNQVVLNELIVGEFVETYAGVLITSRDVLHKEEFEDVSHDVDAMDCYVIVPQENYEG